VWDSPAAEQSHFAQLVVIAQDVPAREREIARIRNCSRPISPWRGRAVRFEYAAAGYPVQYRLSGAISRNSRSSGKLRRIVAAQPHVTAVIWTGNAAIAGHESAARSGQDQGAGLSRNRSGVCWLCSWRVPASPSFAKRSVDRRVLRTPRSETPMSMR